MDIGSLTGQIEIEDQLSEGLHLAIHRVKEFADEFEGALSSVAIGIGIGVTAVTAMTAAVTALGVKGADVDDIASTFEHFSGTAENAEETLRKMQEGTKNTVGDLDLMKDAARLLGADVKLTSDDFGTLTQAAFMLQNRGLGPTDQMLSMVSNSLMTGRTRALEMSIGKMDLSHAEENYAAKLGISADSLSAVEKTEAKRAGIIDALKTKLVEAGQIEGDFGDIINQGKASVENWIDELARAVANSPSVMAAAHGMGDALGEMFGPTREEAMKNIVGLVENFSHVVSATIPYMVGAKDAASGFFGFLGAHQIALSALTTATVSYYGILAGQALIATTGLSGATTLAALAQGEYTMALELGKIAILDTTKALGAFLVMSGPIIVGVAAITAAVVIGYQAWKLYSENRERAAQNERQRQTDLDNTAKLSKVAGIEFRNLGEAQAWANTHAEQLRTGTLEVGTVLRNYAGDITGVVEAHKTLAIQLAESKKAVSALTPEQMKEIQAGVDMKLSTEQLSAALQEAHPTWRLSDEVVKQYTETLEKNKKSTKDLEDQGRAWINTMEEMRIKEQELNEVSFDTKKALQDDWFGDAAIRKARDYAQSIGDISNVSKLNNDQQAAFAKVMLDAEEAMIRTGRATSEDISIFDALRIAATQNSRDIATAIKTIEDGAKNATKEVEGLYVVIGKKPKSVFDVPITPTTHGGLMPMTPYVSDLAQTGVVSFPSSLPSTTNGSSPAGGNTNVNVNMQGVLLSNNPAARVEAEQWVKGAAFAGVSQSRMLPAT